MNTLNVFEKYDHLISCIESYEKVAVAFSGGIDSSLLLYAASQALGFENVLAIHGRSSLNYKISDIDKIYDSFFKQYATLQIVDFEPLEWPDFIKNDKKRCYFCKKMTYSHYLLEIKELGFKYLLDGTNIDDLSQDRPGLAVIEELSVKAPLAEVGLGKKEIRFLAKINELPNHDLASNSCLATRIEKSMNINLNRLQIVEKIENQLKKKGFLGCRAKIMKENIAIEIRQQDYPELMRRHNRLAISEFCQNLGFESIFVNISGR